MSDDKKKSGKLVKVLLISFMLIVFGAAGFFGYRFFIKSKNPETTAVSGKKAKVEEKTVEIGDFVLNLADENTTVLLRTKIFIAYPDQKNKKLDEEITRKMPEIRDLVLISLRLKNSKEFKGNGLEMVRQELIGKMNEVLTHGQLTNIYFQEFIMQ
jgi:flagellar protein FliL